MRREAGAGHEGAGSASPPAAGGSCPAVAGPWHFPLGSKCRLLPLQPQAALAAFRGQKGPWLSAPSVPSRVWSSHFPLRVLERRSRAEPSLRLLQCCGFLSAFPSSPVKFLTRSTSTVCCVSPQALTTHHLPRVLLSLQLLPPFPCTGITSLVRAGQGSEPAALSWQEASPHCLTPAVFRLSPSHPSY